ncbi:MAG: GNAT family N-acetyltransferase [Halioglobus sp.]
MDIRKAVLEDLPKLVDFISEEAREAEGSVIASGNLERGIQKGLEDDSIAMYWVLTDTSGEVVGSISALKEWSDWNAGFYWWIQSMYLVPDQRGKGYMALLLDAVEREMKSQNGIELRLYVHQDNKGAIKAYEKSSFEKLPYEIMVLRK